MNINDLIALLPIITLSAAAVGVMLTVAVRRDYGLTVGLTLLGFLGTLAVLPVSAELTPIQITPLILIDRYAVFFTGLVIFAGATVTLLCFDYFRSLDDRREEVYILLLTACLGAAVLVSSSHFASFFIGLETLSVSLFALIAYPVKDKAPLEAGMKYLILSGVSSAFLLFGMALIYAETGALAFTELGARLSAAEIGPNLLAGNILLIVGLGFKLSLVPFHMWTPDVYQGAPAPVTAFVATVSKGAVFAVLLRYFISGGVYQNESFLTVLSLIAMASILAGNLLALLQDNVKRVLAYSSIAHLGYLLVAFIAGARLGSAFAAEAVAFYLFAYFVTTLGAFGVIAVLSSPAEERQDIADFQALFWTRPLLGAVFATMLLSLAGIPLTVGFIGKFYIFSAGVDAAHWSLVWTVVVGSGIGIYYYLRIVLRMAQSPPEPVGTVVPSARIGGMTLMLLAALSLWFGLLPNSFMEMIEAMGKTLT